MPFCDCAHELFIFSPALFRKVRGRIEVEGSRKRTRSGLHTGQDPIPAPVFAPFLLPVRAPSPAPFQTLTPRPRPADRHVHTPPGLLTDGTPILLVSRLLPLWQRGLLQWRWLLLILLLSFGHRDCGNGCSGIWRAVRKGHAGILFPLPVSAWRG